MSSACAGHIVKYISSSKAYPRHSEGAFLPLSDGRILFVYSRFSGSADDDAPSNLVGMTSNDNGETWTEPVTVIPASMYQVTNVMSASLMRMQNGDIGLFYMVKQAPNHSRIMLSRSNDEGKSFYRHVECTLTDRKAYYVLNNDRVIRLHSGRLLIPLAFHRGGYQSDTSSYFDHRGIIYFLYSDDDGETWQESGDAIYAPFSGSGSGLQEPGLVEIRPGVIMAHFRTDRMSHNQSFSMDHGLSWSKPEASKFTAPCSPMQIVRLDEDIFYAVWNPVPNYNGRGARYGGRTPIVIARSRDQLHSFDAVLTLDDDPEISYCYPSLCRAADGGLLIAYLACHPSGTNSLIIKKISDNF